MPPPGRDLRARGGIRRGRVTKEGATRLRTKLDHAQSELDRGSTAGPIRNRQQSVTDTASLAQDVPGQEARWALVDEADQLIAQLGGDASDPLTARR